MEVYAYHSYESPDGNGWVKCAVTLNEIDVKRLIEEGTIEPDAKIKNIYGQLAKEAEIFITATLVSRKVLPADQGIARIRELRGVS